jgi:hypothetical protein
MRYLYSKGPLDRKRFGATVDADLSIELRFLRAPVVVPYEQVASVVQLTTTKSNVPLLRRDPRVLNGVANEYLDPNVALVFRSPVRIGPFRYGANNSPLGITRRERKRGLDVDAVRLAFEDPDGFVNESLVHGVRQLDSIEDALTSVIGMPTGVQLPTRMAERAAVRRKVVRTIIFGWLSILVAASLKFGADTNRWDVATLLFGVSLAGAAVGAIFGVVLARFRPPKDRPPRNQASGRSLLLRLVMFGAMAWGFILLGNWASGNQGRVFVMFVIVFGVPAGAFAGWTLTRLRQSSSPRPTDAAANIRQRSATEPHRLRR